MSTNLQLITTTSAYNVNTLSITDCFTSAYDVYKIVASIPEYIATDTDVIDFRIQFIDSSGSVISGSEYGTAADKVVYNGPFTLSNWKIEDVYTMSKNPDYWDASSVKIEKVNTKIVKDANAALNLYETGSIDIVGLSSENVDKYKDSPEFKTTLKASVNFFQINGGKGSSK